MMAQTLHAVPFAPPSTTRERFLLDVIEGLAAAPKRMSPKYFYDGAGSDLFDEICDLPEYYLTRTELAILDASAHDIATSLGARVRVLEPGAGSGSKTRLLLSALGPSRCVEYVPLDISRTHLEETATRLRTEIPWLIVAPIHADFTQDLPILPEADDRMADARSSVSTVIYFPGSTLGNFDPPEAERLLTQFRRAVQVRASRAAHPAAAGAIVLGLDLKKDPAILHAAYNDAAGVTAAFNKNVLVRMNRELDANFELSAFAHYAFYDPLASRVEMHLVSLRRQVVTIAGRVYRFREGESLRTERSYKYDLASANRLARAAGLTVERTWLDAQAHFAVLLLRPIRTS